VIAGIDRDSHQSQSRWAPAVPARSRALRYAIEDCLLTTSGSLREQAARGVFWTAVQRWGTSAITFINFTILARLLGPEAYGLVALASVVIAFCSVFLDEGFSTAIIQRAELEPEHLDSAFWATVGLGLLLTMGSLAAAGVVARGFHEPGIRPIFPWLCLSLPISSLAGVQDAILRRSLNFRGLAIRSLAAAIAGMAIAQPLAFGGYGVWSLVWAQLASATVGTAALWRATGWRPRVLFSVRHFRDLVGFGSRMVGTSLLYFFDRRASDFLIGYFLGPAALGLYNMASRLVFLVVDVLTGIGAQVSVPAFSRIQNDPSRLRTALSESIQFASLIAVPCFVGMAAIAPEVIKVLVGSKWLGSVPVLRALCALGIVYAVCFPTNAILTALGRVEWILRLELLQTVSTVVLLVFVVHWGITAVAIAYAGRLVALSPIRIALANRLIAMDVRSYLRCYAAAIAGAGAMLVGLAALNAATAGKLPPLGLLVTEVLFGAVVYSTTTFWLAPALWQRAFEFVRLAIPGTRDS